MHHVTPLIKNIWNIFEDWRVENRLAERFPGCRTNLHWLIQHEFTKRMKKPKNPAMQILSYLLLAVRAWDVKAVEKNRDIVGAFTGIIADPQLPAATSAKYLTAGINFLV